MKSAFTLATLAYAAQAAGPNCDRIERKLNNWTNRIEGRCGRIEGRMSALVEHYTAVFNNDEHNAARASDITEEMMRDFLVEATMGAIDDGSWTPAGVYEDREINVFDCDVDDAMDAYMEAVENVNELIDCYRYCSDEVGPVAASPEMYFCCDNPVFADSDYC